MYARPNISKVVREKLLESTKRQTKFYDVSEPYNVLRKLDVRVDPELEEVDFYGKYRIPEQDYVPLTSKALARIEEQKYYNIRKTVDLDNILNNFDQGHLTFVGVAGSGKTTLMRAIARDVIDGKYQNLGDIEVVHYLEGRNINFTQQLTPAEMLFNNVNPEMSEAELREAMEFARSNPSKVLFVIDSLDTLQQNIDGDHSVIGLEDLGHPQAILWNLLTGKLLPGCRFITSSREHAIRNYKGDLRPNKVIALTGLSKESIDKVVTGYLGEEECQETMNYLETKAPALMSLCSTPVFLVFTLIGLKSPSDFKPSTMSGIMILLLKSLLHSEHARAKNILSVINKLKHLAYIGTDQGRVIFTTDDLSKLGLDPEEVTDVAVVAPGGRHTFLLESQNELVYFIHQSLQEALAAMYLAEMDIEDFKSFLDKNFKNPHYAVVRRFLFGFLLDVNVMKEAGPLINASSGEMKQIVEEQLEGNIRLDDEDDAYLGEVTADRLELLISLSEAGRGLQHFIRSHVRSIDFLQTPLSVSDVHAIGTIAAQCKDLRRLKLSECNLKPQSLQVLHLCLEASDVQVRLLNLTENDDLTSEDFAVILPNVTNELWINGEEEDIFWIEFISEKFLQRQLNLLYPTRKVVKYVEKSSEKNFKGWIYDDKGDLVPAFRAILRSRFRFSSASDDYLSHPGSGLELLPDSAKEEDLDFFRSLLQEHERFLDWMYQQHGAFQRGDEDELDAPFKGLLDQQDEDDPITFEEHKRFLQSIFPHHLTFLTEMMQRHRDNLECIVMSPEDKQEMLQRFESFALNVSQQNQENVIQMTAGLLKQSPLLTVDSNSPREPLPPVHPVNQELLPHLTFIQKMLTQHNVFMRDMLDMHRDSMQNQAKSDAGEKSVASEEKTREAFRIGPDGGDIEQDGCKIHFSKGTFTKIATVSLSAEVGSSQLQEYIGVTPLINVHSDTPLQKPAIVELPTWCESKTSLPVDIFHCSNNKEGWKKIDQVKLGQESFIKFSCKHFSKIGGFIRRLLNYFFSLKLNCLIYKNIENNEFHIAIYLENLTVENRVKSTLTEMSGHLIRPILETIKFKSQDHITAEISTEEDKIQIAPEKCVDIEFDETFQQDIRTWSLHCKTGESINKGKNIGLDFDICVKNTSGKSYERKESYVHTWLGSGESDQPSTSATQSIKRKSKKEDCSAGSKAPAPIVIINPTTYVFHKITAGTMVQGTVHTKNQGCTSNIGDVSSNSEDVPSTSRDDGEERRFSD